MSYDPRRTVKYARMEAVIKLLQAKGPQTLDEICKATKVNEREFKDARYSMHGRLALDDHNVCIPRPVAGEDYTYKLASTYATGVIDTDGEPNIQMATSELLTRVATVYLDVVHLVRRTPGRSKVRRLLQELNHAVATTIISAEKAAAEAGAPISPKAEHVLNIIFPPGTTPVVAPPPVVASRARPVVVPIVKP